MQTKTITLIATYHTDVILLMGLTFYNINNNSILVRVYWLCFRWFVESNLCACVSFFFFHFILLTIFFLFNFLPACSAENITKGSPPAYIIPSHEVLHYYCCCTSSSFFFLQFLTHPKDFFHGRCVVERAGAAAGGIFLERYRVVVFVCACVWGHPTFFVGISSMPERL